MRTVLTTGAVSSLLIVPVHGQVSNQQVPSLQSRPAQSQSAPVKPVVPAKPALVPSTPESR